MIIHPAWIRDTLHNCSYSVTKSDCAETTVQHEIYGRGIVVGIAGWLTATGIEFNCAMKIIAQYLPDDWNPQCIPPSWLEHFVRD